MKYGVSLRFNNGQSALINFERKIYMSKRVSLEEMSKRIAQRYPEEEFEILEYSGVKKPGKIKCLSCGRIIEINSFDNFFTKTKKFGCYKCQNPKAIEREKGIEEIKKRYDILEVFTTSTDTHLHYRVRCKKCGHKRAALLRNLINNIKCGCETGVLRNRTEEEFIDEVNKYSLNGTYELAGEYVNQTIPVLLKHNCGFVWKTRPADIIHGRSACPKCAPKRSKGELLITKILKEMGIDFYIEWPLPNGSRQRFDFYLENDKHKIAIEYNGKQHYEETNFFKIDLETLQARDQKKADFCEENNIDLYIIPYTYSKQQIKQTLLDIINKFND